MNLMKDKGLKIREAVMSRQKYQNYEDYEDGRSEPWHYDEYNRAKGKCQVCYMTVANVEDRKVSKYRVYPPYMSMRPYVHSYNDVYLCEEHRNKLLKERWHVLPPSEL